MYPLRAHRRERTRKRVRTHMYVQSAPMVFTLRRGIRACERTRARQVWRYSYVQYTLERNFVRRMILLIRGYYCFISWFFKRNPRMKEFVAMIFFPQGKNCTYFFNWKRNFWNYIIYFWSRVNIISKRFASVIWSTEIFEIFDLRSSWTFW